MFNAFTGTALQATKRRPVELVLILRGFAQGVSTAQLARELGCDRKELLDLRHRLQHLAWRFRDQVRLDDLDDRFINSPPVASPSGGPVGIMS
jgi:hypothetical protein